MATVKITALPSGTTPVATTLFATVLASGPTTQQTTLAQIRTAVLAGGSGFTGSDYLGLGSTPASTGAIRLTNNTSIYARNAADSADVTVVGVNSSNLVVLAGYAAWPASDGTSGYVLSTDGAGTLSWVAQSGGGGLSDGDKGDITVSSSGTVWSIDAGVITNSHISGSAAIAYSKLALTGAILNADLAGSIADSKLSTISTAGKVANSATTATSANTASAIVARDGSGNFTAGTITAALTGNASTATALATARTINGTSFDGTANITVTAAAGTLTGSTLAAGVTASSLTSVGTLTALTVSGLLSTAASGTGSAGLRVPHGTAPTTPTNGDVWTTTSGLFVRINGTTVTMSIVGHAHAASDITSGTMATARLGSGTADATTYLRGDNTWQTIPGGGDALTSSPLSQFAATTSAQLAGVISDETGSGALVFATSPTLVTPTLGVASVTTVNKVTITAPATGSTLTIQDGFTLTVSGSATISGGTHSGTNTGDQTSVSGNAGTATALATARTINGTSFDGTANITVTAAAGTLTGTTLNSTVVTSSLTSVGTLSSLTLGGTLSMADNELNRPYLSDYAEKASTPSISSGAITIDYTSGNVAIVTMNANITSMTLSNPPASGRVGELTLILKQDGTGSRTVSWPAAVKWPGGTAPTLSGANKVDIITLITDDAGTTWYGASAVNY